ncbi:MAG TPA: hypothetical protein VF460_13755 [Burkholderiales bacterium]
MNKILSMLLAGAAAVALSGGVYAADNKTDPARDSGKDVQNQTQGAPVDQGGQDVTAEGREAPKDATQDQTAGTVNEGNNDVAAEGRDPKKDAYQAELKKCESLTGTEKRTCSDAAKKKHGQM